MLRKTNHLPEAITALESALKTLDDPMLRSEAHFEQAQATAALKQPPAQARALAEQAIADLQNVEGPALERIDAINAWLTTHPP